MEYFQRKTQFNGESPRSCSKSDSNDSYENTNKHELPECDLPKSTQSLWLQSSSSSCTSNSTSAAPTKRKRPASTLCDNKNLDEDCQGPSTKRQCRSSSSHIDDPSSSVSSYPSPVNDLVNEIESRNSNCAGSSYKISIPDSPNSLDYELVEETISTSSPETVSVTSTGNSESEADQTIICRKVAERQLENFNDYLGSQDCMTPTEIYEERPCPLPALSWANAQDVWNLMCQKDEEATYLRDSNMFDYHPELQPRMRAILLDWLIEVCEVYKLHRETYYLAVDYLDRYLSKQKKVQKTHLQLIGITCLFIAAKVEEIYPPKIGEFAYVTDGACQEADILQQEIVILQILDWRITPVTIMGWLGIYMQLNVSNRTPDSLGWSSEDTHKEPIVDDAFIFPQFSGLEFVHTAQLLDLCTLEVGFSNHSYSVIAAAAISNTFSKEVALRTSGLDWRKIEPCARKMEPFFKVIREESPYLHLNEENAQVECKYGLAHLCPNILTDESPIIQSHTITMAMFERACLYREEQALIEKKMKTEASPAIGLKCPAGLLTPPASSRKPADIDDAESDRHVQITLLNSPERDNVGKHTQKT